jgi:cell wall-associated NlpC family hydrolase
LKEEEQDKAEKKYAICALSVIPVRSSPSDASEMISQLLFGELVEIIGKRGKNWRKIRGEWDNYIGWVDPKQLLKITQEQFEKYTETYAHALELMTPAMAGGKTIPLLMGSVLPNFDGITFELKKQKFTYSGQVIFPDEFTPTPDLIHKIAKRYLNAPYQWGGRSPFGIDCSGFTQNVFKIIGIKLPRDSAQQVNFGDTVEFVDFAQTGDLAFFENKNGKIIHVGIVAPDRKIIHASGKVRKDDLDHQGIYNAKIKRYTHKLRIIKRILHF